MFSYSKTKKSELFYFIFYLFIFKVSYFSLYLSNSTKRDAMNVCFSVISEIIVFNESQVYQYIPPLVQHRHWILFLEQ